MKTRIWACFRFRKHRWFEDSYANVKAQSMKNYTVAVTAFFALLMVMLAAPSLAEPQIYMRDGKAIGGYDPVAYFTEKKPVRGNAAFSYKWRNADWNFSSAANRDLFLGNPEKYTPQYGGYCAYAMAFDATASTIPEAWTIVGGKLYLNYSLYVKSQWLAKQAAFISKADENWSMKSFD